MKKVLIVIAFILLIMIIIAIITLEISLWIIYGNKPTGEIPLWVLWILVGK